jgi:hypothetical protein
MSWQNEDLTESPKGAFGSFPINERCFIRKEHECGKMFGPSKSCFIACPTNDDLEPILGLMSEKLSKFGVEPIIAVKDRAYGQDIFCTKICGKIIESRFCIVILDDSIKEGNNIPNPNVYYEYGLMTALRKHIIPLQKEDLELAFNIQSYDTIKYNNKNINSELDIAIRDAIRLTEAKEPEKTVEPMDDKFILRKMELAGFSVRGQISSWYHVFVGTEFKLFRHNEKNFFAFVGKVDNEKDIQDYMEDLNVLTHRIEAKAKDLKEEIDRYKSNKLLSKEEIKMYTESDEKMLECMSRIFIGFITKPEIDQNMLLRSARRILKDQERYTIVCLHDEKIQFGEILADFTRIACY